MAARHPAARQLGWRKATEIRDQAALLAEAARHYRRVEPDAVDVDIDLGSGRRLTGTVSRSSATGWSR